MINKQKSLLNEEIIRMLRISNFGIQKRNTIIESVDKNKFLIKEEDFINDLSSIFDSTEEEEAPIDTSGKKVIIPIELKAAMLAHNISAYQAGLLGLYSSRYSTHTKGATRDNQDTFFDKPSVEKLKGSGEELNNLDKHSLKPFNTQKVNQVTFDKRMLDIIKNKRVPVTFTSYSEDPADIAHTKSLSDLERSYVEKWIINKDFSMISYSPRAGGLTPLGKAQIEFLARAYTSKPGDADEQKLFEILGDKGLHYSSVAERVLYEFYYKALIPIIMNLTHRAKYSPNDTQLDDFIENGLKHALEKLKDSYDPSRGNVGTFIFTDVKNQVKNALIKISDFKVDLSFAHQYLSSLNSPLQVSSIANPNEVSGNYDSVKIAKNNSSNTKTVYYYIYNDPMNALSDLVHDARIHDGKPSPLAKRYITFPSKSLFYKAYPPNPEDIKNGMNIQDYQESEEDKILAAKNLPADAKNVVYNILDNMIWEFTISKNKDNYDKNISSFIFENRDFIKELMFDLFNYGSLVQVYTVSWLKPNGTKIPVGRPVEFESEESNIPISNAQGKKPSETETTWVWSIGEQSRDEVKKKFVNTFLSKMQQSKDFAKAIPQEFLDDDNKRNKIITSLYGAMRQYFGYQGKTNPAIKKNRDEFNALLNNYSGAIVANQLPNNTPEPIQENKHSIKKYFKDILK